MKSTEIIILVAVLLFASIRIYQKYFRKDLKETGKSTGPRGKDSLASTTKDDYEPYSGK